MLIQLIIAYITIGGIIIAAFMTKELKISEMRQRWINDFRNIISELNALTLNAQYITDNSNRLPELKNRIILMLNPKSLKENRHIFQENDGQDNKRSSYTYKIPELGAPVLEAYIDATLNKLSLTCHKVALSVINVEKTYTTLTKEIVKYNEDITLATSFYLKKEWNRVKNHDHAIKKIIIISLAIIAISMTLSFCVFLSQNPTAERFIDFIK